MTEIQPVKNIVFDLGGVLLHIDHQRTYDKMSEVLNRSFSPEDMTPEMHKLLLDFETGTISTEVFIWNIQRMSLRGVPSGNQVAEAWNAMLLGWNEGVFQLLEALRARYKVYLLSNTNEIHLQWILITLKHQYEISDWDTRFFDQTFYSHRVGMRKPNKEIYDHVVENTGIIPENTLFIDDTPANLETPREAGWQTYLHHPDDDIVEVVRNVLKLL